MVVDVIFDSLCRCFGAPGSQTPPDDQTSSHNNKSGRRSSDLVQLKDKQFDALFVESSKKVSTKHTAELEQAAHAVAKAKRSASSRRYKRKSPATRRDEIFRTRGFEQREKPEPAPWGGVYGLCFATPVVEDGEINDLVKTESDDCATLNTCEDTVTSTLFFERKYAHIVESRPPMPLFHQFKVSTQESDELRKIVASDSHNSLKMIRLLEDHHHAIINEKVVLEESEEEDVVSMDDDVPPVVKIDSSTSSASSRRY